MGDPRRRWTAVIMVMMRADSLRPRSQHTFHLYIHNFIKHLYSIKDMHASHLDFLITWSTLLCVSLFCIFYFVSLLLGLSSLLVLYFLPFLGGFLVFPYRAFLDFRCTISDFLLSHSLSVSYSLPFSLVMSASCSRSSS